MALTVTRTDVTWPTTTTYGAVTAGGNATSDLFTLDATCIEATVTLEADAQAGPASTDLIYVWWLGTQDGTNMDTVNHAKLLCVLNTSLEDPARKTVEIPSLPKRFKLYAEGASAGSSNTIWVEAAIEEQRAA